MTGEGRPSPAPDARGWRARAGGRDGRRPADLVGGLLRLLDGVDLAHGDIDRRLDQALTTAVELFGVDGAGLMLVTEKDSLRFVAASGPAGRALEQGQEWLNEGPGIECTRRRAVLSISDLEASGRWPALMPFLRPHSVVAVLSAPIWLRGQPAGNLNLFRHDAHEWSDKDAEAISAYAGVMTAFLRIALEARHQGEVIDGLRRSLDGEPQAPPAVPDLDGPHAPRDGLGVH